MKWSERRAIENDLPKKYRGRVNYKSLLDTIDHRIAVTGVRGKSGLVRLTARELERRGLSTYAKVTGDRPVSIKDGVEHAIDRSEARDVLLDETMWEVKRHWPVDAIVLENQAIGNYTMRVFNEVFARPHFVLLTNVRRDHVGRLGPNKVRIARAFAQSVPADTVLISGTRNPHVREVLNEHLEAKGATFVDASPPDKAAPAMENITILDELLRRIDGDGLGPRRRQHLQDRLDQRFTWWRSRLPDVRWFHAAPVNDIDSTRMVLDYLQSKDPRPVSLVVYLRRDRPGRTSTFVDFLRERFDHGDVVRAYVAGERSRTVARNLKGYQVQDVGDEIERIPGIVRTIGMECRGGAVMTVGNGVPPWPRVFAHSMRPDSRNARVRIWARRVAQGLAQPRPEPKPMPAVRPRPLGVAYSSPRTRSNA